MFTGFLEHRTTFHAFLRFNETLFTVGHDLPPGAAPTPANHDPDYRELGACFWNQDTRLIYYPLIAAGDYDLLKPWFDMYLRALPLEKARTKAYYHHSGAYFPETMYFWGLPNLHDFGWGNSTVELQTPWVRYHIQGTLEIISQMLDAYDNTQDPRYVRDVVPFADAIIYYAENWPRDPNGKIHMAPVQSLETYELDAVNPTPDIAGLKSIIPRLLALPKKFISSEQRVFWAKTLNDLPPIPMGKTAHGKLPPDPIVMPMGTPSFCPRKNTAEPATAKIQNCMWPIRIGSMAWANPICNWHGTLLTPGGFQWIGVGGRMARRPRFWGWRMRLGRSSCVSLLPTDANGFPGFGTLSAAARA